MLLSLFSGAGGLDLGFEQTGAEIGLAFDIRQDSINSYNSNRPDQPTRGYCKNIRHLTITELDELFGAEFRPTGIIGGPPCQSFSRANKSQTDDDPRHELPFVYADLIDALNQRSPVPFFAFENVVGLTEGSHRERFLSLKSRLSEIGFEVHEAILNSADYGVPQNRTRLIMVGFNRDLCDGARWTPPPPQQTRVTVRQTFAGLPEPIYFHRSLEPKDIPHHPNHWCMQPKSPKFRNPGALVEGRRAHRSFKTLSWDEPSITVAYGHREVHVHPGCHRRLSVFEAMLLQGFPRTYVLTGNLSSQITQISEAVPPPLAEAIAISIRDQLQDIEPQRTAAAA
ncbi:DNA cytosine methyltransferase [Burkholderia stagnalis]|uniref:DNA cytosine methyltransferase n=1 Tax=Burkholderia stagnalis TaxID=1503054 RepID=UPI000F55C5D4|nr:DNA cytosine methyltransferase [Burkholderia stagnalis]RQQ46167.1 DNA cytosine methyltransferase [Burkholderia stagnalis]RQY03311.1 DNA cytosine methyltransferase [Burkholderia stagnalis]RQY15140.1 DNA cytosine methyltransferase [Burkholderia stagnalis]RQY34931.1 DNA cytosine methyltransferase [Burkholderia stagnalis]